MSSTEVKVQVCYENPLKNSPTDERPYFLLKQEDRTVRIDMDFSIRKNIGTKSDLLSKSVGYKKNKILSILDVTAGLCRDSFHLACLGCNVTGLEKNKILFEVASYYTKKLPVTQRLNLLNIDSFVFLDQLEDLNKPDVIYMDPMFPESKKSAKSGKETELLKAIAPIESPDNEKRLLKLCRNSALSRVVVKRPLHAEPISKPDIQYKGKAVRYDVYLSINLAR
jgi:16S rRNA (guanine1516-N2)-methyltransferase